MGSDLLRKSLPISGCWKRQNFASLLEEAERSGEVRIRRKNGQVFVLRPERGGE